MKNRIVLFLLLLYCANIFKCDLRSGPDPWHQRIEMPDKVDESHLPADLKSTWNKKEPVQTKFGFGEWWFKRLLAMILKSGQVKKSEDGSIDVSLQMKFHEEKWDALNDYLKLESPLSDAMFRQSVGYVEEAIYKPTLTDKIILSWNEYIQGYLTESKVYITWTFGSLGAIGILVQSRKHISLKHIIIVVLVALYVYEVVISYMEAEQQEYEKFISAVNTCKWYFWTSECTVPSPDPILFLKHMNPMKIAIRMFTTLLSEPILAINSTVKITLQDITDGLWYPFNKIMYGLLIVLINISLLYLLIMIIFNFIFNISFNFNFLGIIGINVKRNRETFIPKTTREGSVNNNHSVTDRISGDTLDKLLNVCSLALTNIQNPLQSSKNKQNNDIKCVGNHSSQLKLRRSASTGRLGSLSSTGNNDILYLYANNSRKMINRSGDGDH